MTRKLRVRGTPGVLVPNPFALGTNPPRFVGKVLDFALPAKTPLHERLVDVDAELDDHVFIRDAVRRGHLVALDAETARLCGVTLPSDER